MPSERTVCMGITQQLTEILQTMVWVSSPVGSVKGDKNTGTSGQTLESQHVSITSFIYYVCYHHGDDILDNFFSL